MDLKDQVASLENQNPGYNQNTIDGYNQVRNALVSIGTTNKNNTLFNNKKKVPCIRLAQSLDQVENSIEVRKKVKSRSTPA
jgi:hypothetical protein